MATRSQGDFERIVQLESVTKDTFRKVPGYVRISGYKKTKNFFLYFYQEPPEGKRLVAHIILTSENILEVLKTLDQGVNEIISGG